MRYLVKDKSQQAVVINIQYKQIPGGPLDPCYSHCSVESTEWAVGGGYCSAVPSICSIIFVLHLSTSTGTGNIQITAAPLSTTVGLILEPNRSWQHHKALRYLLGKWQWSVITRWRNMETQREYWNESSLSSHNLMMTSKKCFAKSVLAEVGSNIPLHLTLTSSSPALASTTGGSISELFSAGWDYQSFWSIAPRTFHYCNLTSPLLVDYSSPLALPSTTQPLNTLKCRNLLVLCLI